MTQRYSSGLLTACLLIFVTALSGCTGYAPGDGGDTSPERPGATFFLNLTRADLADAGNMQAVLRVVEGGLLNATLALIRPAQPPEAWEGCGGATVKHVRAGATLAQDGFLLSESRGHALIVPNGGDPVVIPAGGIAPENLALGGSILKAKDLQVEEGDHLVVDLSMRGGAGSLYDGFLNVTSATAVVEVVAASTSRFMCGANLGNFSGGGFSVGVGGLGPTLVRDGRLAEEGTRGIEGAFFFIVDPRTGGACDVAIHINKAEANTSGRRLDACSVWATGGPGEIAFVIKEAVASGPDIAYYFWDRGPSLPELRG